MRYICFHSSDKIEIEKRVIIEKHIFTVHIKEVDLSDKKAIINETDNKQYVSSK